MTRSLIVGVDDTDDSRNALARAADVFRSHDLSLHVDNTVGLAKTAGVFGAPLVLTNGADTGPYGPLFTAAKGRHGQRFCPRRPSEWGRGGRP